MLNKKAYLYPEGVQKKNECESNREHTHSFSSRPALTLTLISSCSCYSDLASSSCPTSRNLAGSSGVIT
jgi:hypothetical protein